MINDMKNLPEKGDITTLRRCKGKTPQTFSCSSLVVVEYLDCRAI